MAIVIIRTLIIYFALLLTMRLLGKRQLGEMELSEFVLAALIADLASHPLQDIGIPMINGLVPILVLFCCEVIIAGITMTHIRLRSVFFGKPSLLVVRGRIDQREMRKNRFTVDELMEELRNQSCMDISRIEYAILETSGNLSVFPKPAAAPVTQKDLQLVPKRKPPALPLVLDGQIQHENLRIARLEQDALLRALDRAGVELRCAFFVAFSDPRTLLIQLPGGHQTHVTVKCHD